MKTGKTDDLFGDLMECSGSLGLPSLPKSPSPQGNQQTTSLVNNAPSTTVQMNDLQTRNMSPLNQEKTMTGKNNGSAFLNILLSPSSDSRAKGKTNDAVKEQPQLDPSIDDDDDIGSVPPLPPPSVNSDDTQQHFEDNRIPRPYKEEPFETKRQPSKDRGMVNPNLTIQSHLDWSLIDDLEPRIMNNKLHQQELGRQIMELTEELEKTVEEHKYLIQQKSQMSKQISMFERQWMKWNAFDFIEWISRTYNFKFRRILSASRIDTLISTYGSTFRYSKQFRGSLLAKFDHSCLQFIGIADIEDCNNIMVKIKLLITQQPNQREGEEDIEFQ
ncbi:hypothetical protein RFI_17113 [Reticulomyxa filosa]|uniref:Uncharacterized protein n=1 Tax=Reticulomyxa filosa TaxID=46433 RepID=X6N2Y4_RETFI|nr:hypothetical protein RFI_17113 [Reticulomyxa filosa]|eukprot:ETO20104.1 hypothetical protein RFI_17113 [Reticulomyxa filosa]